MQQNTGEFQAQEGEGAGKSCGGCKWWAEFGAVHGKNIGDCLFEPALSSAQYCTDAVPMYLDEGTKCPVWQART